MADMKTNIGADCICSNCGSIVFDTEIYCESCGCNFTQGEVYAMQTVENALINGDADLEIIKWYLFSAVNDNWVICNHGDGCAMQGRISINGDDIVAMYIPISDGQAQDDESLYNFKNISHIKYVG